MSGSSFNSRAEKQIWLPKTDNSFWCIIPDENIWILTEILPIAILLKLISQSQLSSLIQVTDCQWERISITEISDDPDIWYQEVLVTVTQTDKPTNEWSWFISSDEAKILTQNVCRLHGSSGSTASTHITDKVPN